MGAWARQCVPLFHFFAEFARIMMCHPDKWQYDGSPIPEGEITNSLENVLRRCLRLLPFQNPRIRVFVCIYKECCGKHTTCYSDPKRQHRTPDYYHLFHEVTALETDKLRASLSWFSPRSGAFSLLCCEGCYEIGTRESLKKAFSSVFSDEPSPLPPVQGKQIFGKNYLLQGNRRHIIVPVEVDGPRSNADNAELNDDATGQCNSCGKNDWQRRQCCPRAYKNVQETLDQIQDKVQESLKRFEQVSETILIPARLTKTLTSNPCPINSIH